jgi:hypothetical protein
MRNPFSPSRDDRGVRLSRRITRAQQERALDDALAGRSAADPALSEFVADARELISPTPPAPSPLLAAMLEAGVPDEARQGAGRGIPAPRQARTWPRVAFAGGTALGLLVGAAAANALPRPAQNAVADVVSWVSPVHLPHADRPHPAVSPTPAPSPAVPAGPAGSLRSTTNPNDGPTPPGTTDRESGATGGHDDTRSSASPTPAETSGGDGSGSGPRETSSPSPEPSQTDGSGGTSGGPGPDSPTSEPSPTSDGH